MAKEWTNDAEVRQIAEKLIEIFKPELEGFEIRYIRASENPKKDGAECVALARKVTGFYAYLAGWSEGFFVIETGEPAFAALTPNEKIAAIHHELCHFGITEIGNLTLYPHDIEEFTEIARVHGAYFDRLQIFADAAVEGNSDNSGRAELIKQILGEN